MSPELKIIIYEEKNILKRMLNLLDEQYEYVINKEVLKMDKIAKDLDCVAKELATTEINRRKIMGSEANIREVVEDSNDENIKLAYEEIKSTLKMIQIQKDANNMLIKQRLFFTKKMINYIKPNQSLGTYNANGQVGR